jgi:hypothetical protein
MKRLTVSILVTLAVLLCPKAPFAAEYLTTEQLHRLFSGSVVHASGGECNSAGQGTTHWNFDLKEDGRLEVIFTCEANLPFEERSSGKWRIGANKLCMEGSDGLISRYTRDLGEQSFIGPPKDKCWRVKPGTSFFDGYGSDLRKFGDFGWRDESYFRKVWEFTVFNSKLPNGFDRQVAALARAAEMARLEREAQRVAEAKRKLEPRRLNEAEVIALTQGGPFSGTTASGDSFKVEYHPNGTLDGTSGTAMDYGTWEVVNDTICTQWGVWRNHERFCFYVELRDDGSFESFFLNGDRSSIFVGKVYFKEEERQKTQRKAEAERKAKEEARRVAEAKRKAEAKQKLASKPASTPLPQPKPSLPVAKSRDTTPPTITIPTAITVKTASTTIKGRVTDNTQVVQVTVEGVAVDIKPDGSFSFPRYVPVSGTSLKVEAFDGWGNRSERTIKITRAVAKTTDQVTLAKLNPTTINGRSNPNAIALIIGVANYSRAPTATYADNDANVFGDYAHRALGIPRSNIKVMVNNKASLADTRVAIQRWLRGRIEEGKTDVHVFFAGHGLTSPDGKDLYLLPYDGEPSLLDGTALLRRELFEVIGKAKPKSATIFLDTCYSGLSRGKETLLASARPIFIRAKEQSVPQGFTVLSAASGQQISSGLKEAKHGLFSYYLMKGMEGGADANKDRKITASELHAYLGSRVQRQAIRLGREQTPELSGDGERVLVRW